MVTLSMCCSAYCVFLGLDFCCRSVRVHFCVCTVVCIVLARYNLLGVLVGATGCYKNAMRVFDTRTCIALGNIYRCTVCCVCNYWQCRGILLFFEVATGNCAVSSAASRRIFVRSTYSYDRCTSFKAIARFPSPIKIRRGCR